MRLHRIVLLTSLCFMTGCLGRACHDSQEVAYEEFGPRAALQKYEWFKDAAASLEKKQADIKVFQTRLTNMEKDYEGSKRQDWDRTDKEQFNQWETELSGLKASYNQLAAEYNANMAKINWSFAEAGKLPPGATTPLPRAFKPYEES